MRNSISLLLYSHVSCGGGAFLYSYRPQIFIIFISFAFLTAALFLFSYFSQSVIRD